MGRCTPWTRSRPLAAGTDSRNAPTCCSATARCDSMPASRHFWLSTGESGWAYVWPGGDVREEDWDAAEFEARHLVAYAARCPSGESSRFPRAMLRTLGNTDSW